MKSHGMAVRGLLLLSVVVLLVAPLVGMHALSWGDIWLERARGHKIFWELRLPRVCLA